MMSSLVLYAGETLGVLLLFVVCMLALYMAARLVTTAYFKSKDEAEKQKTRKG